MAAVLRFDAVRSDWFTANTLIPRLITKAVLTSEPLQLVGFPAQWIPVCVHYGIELREPRAPTTFLPLFSDLPPCKIQALADAAKARGASRPLVEAVVALDPVIADLVYIVDHKLAAAGHDDPAAGSLNFLNTWHSFARPEIVKLQKRMCSHVAEGDIFVMLPCSRHRPYNESRTHARLAHRLAESGHVPAGAERVVVTALGVIPEAYWREPLVMSYDAGAVDLWRVFQLLRVFFTVNHPRLVVDCLSFKPYSDMLGLLRDLGLIATLIRPMKIRWRSFHVTLA